MTRSEPIADLTWQTWSVERGRALVAWSPRGLCAVFIADDDETLLTELTQTFPCRQLRQDDAVQPWGHVVRAVLNGEERDLAQVQDLPLDVIGTPLQQSVWKALRDIPPGQTVSYSELADRLGQPKAVRAVASACAANVLAVLIPCHRVVRRDGSASGYRWGLARKQALLAREAMR